MEQLLGFLCHLGNPEYIIAAKSLQSCPTLRNPIDGSPSGSPIPGIIQARTLEWVAISFSNASFPWCNTTVVTTHKGATLREREDCEEGLSAKDGKQKDAKAESRLLGSLGAPTLVIPISAFGSSTGVCS